MPIYYLKSILKGNTHIHGDKDANVCACQAMGHTFPCGFLENNRNLLSKAFFTTWDLIKQFLNKKIGRKSFKNWIFFAKWVFVVILLLIMKRVAPSSIFLDYIILIIKIRKNNNHHYHLIVISIVSFFKKLKMIHLF